MDSLDFWLESVRTWLDSIPIPKLEGESSTLQFVGKTAYLIYRERKVVQSFVHVLAAALFPIYIGSHASLRCPPSAMEVGKGVAVDSATGEDEDDGLENLEDSTSQGLTPFDAIVFPLVAACVLTALYFLIKWLEDPWIISKVLGWYFSLGGVFAVGNLIGDSLNVGTSFIFPAFWSSGGHLFFIDQPLLKQPRERQLVARNNEWSFLRHKSAQQYSHFLGRSLVPTLSEKSAARMWSIRDLFLRSWIFRGYIHGGLLNIRSRVRLNDIIGHLLAIVVVVVYNMSGRAWWLSNLISFGFCYSTLRFLSLTTFWTGTLVLVGLFVYDIFMVFYTYVATITFAPPLLIVGSDCLYIAL
jgi:minor histocompatibility antigen H13